MPATKYNGPLFCERAKILAANGATDREISKELNIDPTTFYVYCNRYPEFADAVRAGKERADDRVERALLARALGYDVQVEKPMLSGPTKEVTVVTYTEHIPADVNAQKLWLTNRRPHVYRETTRQELTGPGGGPIQALAISDVELARRLAFVLKTGEMQLDTQLDAIEHKPAGPPAEE